MSRKHSKRRKASSSEWQRLNEDATLRTAYLELTKALEGASIQSQQTGRPVDLRNAGNVLAKYPQLTLYLEDIRERQEADKAARGLPMELMSKASPTGNTMRDTSQLGGWNGGYVDKNQPQGVPNTRVLRDYAESSEWTRAAINYYCERISRADIDVIPADERAPYNRTTEKSIKLLLDQPNEFGDTWPMLMHMMINDYLTLGRGFWSKNMTAKRVPTALYCEDGATIKTYPAWSGNPDEPRFLYDAGNNNKTPLRNDEIVCFSYGMSSYRLSLSPVQILRNTILSDLKATESASRLVDMKPPPTMIQLPGATESQIRTLRSVYDSELAGRREVLFLGGANPALVKSLVFSLKDNQWMEWMAYLVKKIAAIFQLSPINLGFYEDANRSTSEVQQDISEDKGLMPTMLKVEEQLNRGVLADFAPHMSNGRTNINALNLRIVFPEISETARQMHAEQAVNAATKSLAGLPSQTLNMVLTAMGQESVPGGNTFFVGSANGPIPWLSYDNFDGLESLALGGSIGSQDADGGPTIDDTVDDDMGQSDNKSESPANDNTSNASSSNGNESTSQPSSGNAGSDVSSSTEKHMEPWTRGMIDARRPGQAWQPHMLRRSASSSQTTQRHPITSIDQTKATLASSVETVLRGVERRGRGIVEGMQ